MISRAFEKSYHGRTVLSMPERDWKPNVIYAVIGANGSGKSTLAKILSGTESADEGVKVLNGVSVGYLPQKAYAFRMSVEDNLRVNGKDSDRASHLLSSL